MKKVFFAVTTVITAIFMASLYTLFIFASEFDDENGMGD